MYAFFFPHVLLLRLYPPTPPVHLPCLMLLPPFICGVLGRQGGCYPPHAGTGPHVTGADVRRRQRRRRLMATLSLERASERAIESRPLLPPSLPPPHGKKKLSASFRNPLGDCCQPVCTEESGVWGGFVEEVCVCAGGGGGRPEIRLCSALHHAGRLFPALH